MPPIRWENIALAVLLLACAAAFAFIGLAFYDHQRWKAYAAEHCEVIGTKQEWIPPATYYDAALKRVKTREGHFATKAGYLCDDGEEVWR